MMAFTRCTRCLIPNTRPDTHFEDGVCSACRAYEARPAIDREARKRELIALLDRHDGRCLVPSSGGKDSTAQVRMLKGLGADVTVVTATTCQLTPLGRANIDNLARHAAARNLFHQDLRFLTAFGMTGLSTLACHDSAPT